MCGIAGVVGGGRPVDRALLDAMVDVLHHRGPDDRGTWVDGDVGLGMRRLAIVDVAHGQQPMHDAAGRRTIVFNGEIYDAPATQRRLEEAGHSFRTSSDTEAILHLHEDHGAGCVEHLRGMFALAVWDADERTLLLARDRLGKKPLYYRVDGDRLWFASELKALLVDPSFRPAVDPVALHHYLGLQYVPHPHAIVRGVRKLPPGHVLEWRDGRIAERRYWDVHSLPKLGATDAEAVELVRDSLLEATRLRLLSERPVGAFLSGGVDSSLVVAAMARLVPGRVRTFTIGFDEASFDERSHARAVAERFGTEHHELVVRPSALDALPRLVWHFDEPFADSSAIPTFALAELAASEVVVALNGDGADESFAGYTRYRYDRVLRRLSPLVGPLAAAASLAGRAGIAPAARLGRRARRWTADRGASPVEGYARFMTHFDAPARAALYTPEQRALVAGVEPEQLLVEAWDTGDALDRVERLLHVDRTTYLPGDLLVKMDRATMAHSLEARSPFLDHVLVEQAARLSPDQKLRGRTGKWVLKELARGWLPDQVIDRPKQGFGVPMAAWLRGELRDLSHDLLTDDRARSRGWFEPASVQALLDEHAAGIDRSTRIWNLLVLEAWHRRHLDGEQAA